MIDEISEYVEHAPYLPGSEDRAGNTIDGWGVPVTVGIYVFDPGSSSEPREAGHERVIVEPTLYMPTTAVFGARDKVTVRGKTYEVEGETREWRHPEGDGPDANVVTLRRVEG